MLYTYNLLGSPFQIFLEKRKIPCIQLCWTRCDVTARLLSGSNMSATVMANLKHLKYSAKHDFQESSICIYICMYVCNYVDNMYIMYCLYNTIH